jgi:malate dehydrogenase (oxaloacetate-decarboxylating)(NADP+)
MIMHNEADALITGTIESYSRTFNDITKVIELRTGGTLFGFSAISTGERNIFIADSAINEFPTSEMLANIAIQSASEVKKLGIETKVALISFSSFGSPLTRHLV